MSLDRPLCLRAILSYLPRFFGPVSGEYYRELAQKPYIVPIPGTTKLHRLEENFKGAEVELSAQELADINDALAKLDINETFF